MSVRLELRLELRLKLRLGLWLELRLELEMLWLLLILKLLRRCSRQMLWLAITVYGEETCRRRRRLREESECQSEHRPVSIHANQHTNQY
jgi:hypothetical protein